MGWFAFFEIAHAKYFGIKYRVKIKAIKKANPARTDM
jgi:hypothetical protein